MKKSGFWETFILIAIVLVIGQTFLEEIAMVKDWPLRWRHLLVFTGLFFDLLFSIEYVIRQVGAARRKQGIRYLLQERGWIDLSASLPLLLFNSGPQALLLLSGGGFGGAEIGFLTFIKMIKALRVTRVLRFIRMIKLFGKIHNVDSHMAQRHITRISSIAVVLIVVVLFLAAIVGGGFTREDFIAAKRAEYERLITSARSEAAARGLDYGDMLATMVQGRSDFLLLRMGESKIAGKMDMQGVRAGHDADQVVTIPSGRLSILVSLKEFDRRESWQNLIYLCLIIMLVLTYLFIYTKHFAQTVSDVVHVMYRGMSEAEYNLEVLIREPYARDEIFQLARLYNEQWLPLKDKYRPLGEKSSERSPTLSLDDFFGTRRGDGDQSSS